MASRGAVPKSKRATVEIGESVPLMVGNWLLKHKGYGVFPADSEGRIMCTRDHTHAVFTADEMNDPLGLRKHTIKRVLRGPFLRYLCLSATKDIKEYAFIGIVSVAGKNIWSLKVFGRKHVPLCAEIALELQKDFSVRVKVKLVEEKERLVDCPYSYPDDPDLIA